MTETSDFNLTDIPDAFDFIKLYENFIDDDNEPTESPISNKPTECKYVSPDEIPQDITNTGFSIFCINCQSINSHWNELCELKLNMSSETFQFDVIGLTETFRPLDNTRYELPGYHTPIFNIRDKTDDSHGGVGMFIKSNINFQIRKDLSIFIPHVIESLFIEIKNKKNIILGVIYRPNTPPRADTNTCIENILSIVKVINKENKIGYLMGDFNLDLLKYITNNTTTTFIDNMISHCFIPQITKPTRVNNKTATLIDNIFTNKHLENDSAGIVITDLSDHFGIYHITKIETINEKPKYITTRTLKEKNITNFKNSLLNTDFSLTLNTNCANTAYNNFLNTITIKLDETCPKKTRKITHKMSKREPWITENIINMSKHKQKLLKNKLKKPSVNNINNYKNICNEINKEKRKEKQTYYDRLLQENKNNIKKTWRILNQAINKHNDKHDLPCIFEINNRDESNCKNIANKFNEFFSTIGSELAGSIPTNQTDYKSYLENNTKDTFFLIPTDPVEIIKTTKYLQPKKSTGIDEISTHLLKEIIEETCIPLTHIINLSFSHGTVPEKMKIAKIIPIYKSGNKKLFNNYRPISILPSFSKLLEKLVTKRLVTFLDQNNILYKYQFGFRKKHSTTHAILHFLNDIATNNDKPTKDNTLALFLDLSKAFDTINHSQLLYKLQTYGIRGLSNIWFQNYLNNRKQYVQFKDENSKLCNITCGVPQGSILGPILFLIYINDIKNSTKLKLLSFADDTTVYSSSSSLDTLFTTSNAEIQHLYTWLCVNKLSLNISKTNYALFGPSSNKINTDTYSLSVNGSQIKRSNDENPIKFLGLYIDETINWKTNISHIHTKLCRSIYIVNKVKNILPKSALLTLYYSLFHSHITYGLSIWGNSDSSNKIFKLQKTIIRIINKRSYRSHTEILFKNSKIPKLEDLYKLHIILFMHDYRNYKLPISFANQYKTSILNRKNNFYQETPRTKFSSQLPKHKFPKIWNCLPDNLKCLASRNILKHRFINETLASYKSMENCTNPLCPDCVQ